ncbi:MAG: response regulator transcription factor [Bacteroidaceae bacterium]|nr:response regulator transcription factor [Bacteroidaceae bacterium]
MIRCLAIDDEPLALEQIARYIRRIPSLELVGTCLTARQAQAVMEQEQIDLLFLDIEMPGMSGVEFAKYLTTKHNDANELSIVFTTAYPQYAIEGFRVDAVDYLLKPLSFEDLENAVEKVKRRITKTTQEQENCIYIKVSGSLRKIHKSDILFIKGLSEYVQICVKDEAKFLTTHETLKHFESVLAADNFLRIHKSFLVNLSYLEGASADHLTLSGHQLPIGQKYRPAIRQYLKSL